MGAWPAKNHIAQPATSHDEEAHAGWLMLQELLLLGCPVGCCLALMPVLCIQRAACTAPLHAHADSPCAGWRFQVVGRAGVQRAEPAPGRHLFIQEQGTEVDREGTISFDEQPKLGSRDR